MSDTLAIFSCVFGKEVAVEASAGLRWAAVACILRTAAEGDEGAILADGEEEDRRSGAALPRLVAAAACDERAAPEERLLDSNRRIWETVWCVVLLCGEQVEGS